MQYKEKSVTPANQPMDKLAANSLPLILRQHGNRADVSVGRSIRYCSREPNKFVTVPGGNHKHCPNDLLLQSSTIGRPSLPTNASKKRRQLFYINIVRVAVVQDDVLLTRSQQQIRSNPPVAVTHMHRKRLRTARLISFPQIRLLQPAKAAVRFDVIPV